MLTNQTKWHRIEPHLSDIDTLFFNYDPSKILSKKPEYFCKALFELKCGNMSTVSQMNALPANINVLKKIEYSKKKLFGSNYLI